MTKGPKLTDEVFFQALSDNLADIKKYAQDGNYGAARKEFSRYIRTFLDTKKFFEIPYETPENIFKLPGESDAEACRRIEEYKVVSVGVLGDFSSQKRIGWFDNPTSNGYKEWVWQLSRHNEIKMMAHEYNITGDEKIAETALDIMQSWLEDAPAPELGVIGYATDCWRTIECGIRMGANWPYILFSFIKSPYFSDDLIVNWFKSIYEHALRLSHDRTRANWLIMEMNGLAHIGILFPFFKQSSNWVEDAVSTLEREIDVQFYSDGFQYELTTNYHDVVLNNYQRLFETAKAFGYALPETLMKKLVKACKIDVVLMMPDGRLPDINDGTKEYASVLLKPKARFFSDGDIDFVLGNSPEPQYTSAVLPYSGFAVFRSGWKQNDVWALFDSAPFGRAHQHEDKLNFLLFGCGKLLITEGGNYAYDESEMRKYILSTRSHNTVRADGRDQDRRSSYKWEDEDIKKHSLIKSNIPDPEIEWAEGSYTEGYSNIADKSIVHTRKVFFIRKHKLFAVIDNLKAAEKHDWQLIWHVDDTLVYGTEFENIKILFPFDEADIEIVKGVKEPEVQGFIALSQKQDDCKEVNTILVKSSGNESRLITLLQPKDEKAGMIVNASLEKDNLKLDFGNETISLDI